VDPAEAAAREAAYQRTLELMTRPSDPFAPPPGLPYVPPPDAELQARVARLAAHPRVTGSVLGPGDTPSAAWAAWQAVLAQATRQDLFALLAHPSPVVRGYVVRHIVTAMPFELPRLYPLLADTAWLATLEGCFVPGGGRFGEVLLEELCPFGQCRPGALDLLVRAASDTALPLSVRGVAVEWAARAGRHEVRGAAISLHHSDDAEVRARAERALRALGIPADAG
jgi:hypothetical protein